MERYDDKSDERVEGGADGQDDTVARLMNLAGPRPAIPAGLDIRVYEKVEHEWLATLPRRRLMRWSAPLALAASVLLVVIMNRTPIESEPPAIATIVRVAGGASASVGQAVRQGDTLRTEPGEGLGLRLPGGISLRIAGGSWLRIDGFDDFTLLSGRIYADSGQSIYRDRHITINTATGSVTDVGTQFVVKFDNNELAVAVREGRVDIAAGQKNRTATAGHRLLMKSNDDVVVDQISASDESWDWAVALAPGFDIDNQSLLDFLKWAARETGKELAFANDEVRMAAMKVKLHGSVSNLTPIEATESVLTTTNFVYQIDQRRITIIR